MTKTRRPPARPAAGVGVFASLAGLVAVLLVGIALQRGILGERAGEPTASAEAGDPPPLVEDADLAALFMRPPADPIVTSTGAARLTVEPGPSIQLPDGRLVAGDVFGLGERAAFPGVLPAGEVPVLLLMAAFAEDERVAAVLVGDGADLSGLAWTAAHPDGASAEPGELAAFPVDSGTAGFTSARAARRIATDAAYVELALEALEGSGFVDPVRFALDEARTLDVLAVPSGWGDGAYVTWAGTDATGATIAYLTSFDVLDRPR